MKTRIIPARTIIYCDRCDKEIPRYSNVWNRVIIDYKIITLCKSCSKVFKKWMEKRDKK